MPRKIRKLAACTLSALFLALPYWNGRFWIFAWFGFVPVFFGLSHKSLPRAFFLFFVAGVFYWSATVYWLVHVTLAGTIALILYLALYFAVFGLIIRPCTKSSTPYTLLFIPSVWVVLEYIRGHLFTGFPWALLAHSQYLNLPVIQIADITGAYGVSFLIMTVNVAIVEIIWSAKEKLWMRLKTVSVSSALLLLLVLSYGFYRLHSSALPLATHPSTLRICVIQANIPQEVKWEVYSRDYIVDTYVRLTRAAAKDKPDMIIWPEAALPVIAEEGHPYYEKVKGLAKEINIPILLGAVTCRDDNYYNSALLISRKGRTLGQYDKVHLVPFGEYIPLHNILPFLQTIVPIGEAMAGKEHTVFDTPAPFSVLICFEDLFPELSRRSIKAGARFLVNITNDAWYKKTPAAYQHLAASVFRAIENRVFLIRATNTGISAFINPQGKIISSVKDNRGSEMFVAGYSTQEISF